MLPPSPSRIQLFPRHEINSVATASASQFVTLLLVIMMVTIFSRLLELFLIVVKIIVISYTSNCTHSVSIVKIKVDFPFYILKANISIIFVCLYSLFITFISAFPDDIKVSSACRWSRTVFLLEYDGHCGQRDHFKTSSKSWSHCWWLFQNVNQRPQDHVHLKQCSPVFPLAEMFAWSLLTPSSVWRWRSCEGTRWPGPPCGCARAVRPWCAAGGPGHHPAKTIYRVCPR